MSLTHAASGTHFNEPDFNDVVAREPERVVRVELAWQPAFNVAKHPYGQGGRGSDDGGGVAYRRYSLECVADEDAVWWQKYLVGRLRYVLRSARAATEPMM